MCPCHISVKRYVCMWSTFTPLTYHIRIDIDSKGEVCVTFFSSSLQGCGKKHLPIYSNNVSSRLDTLEQIMHTLGRQSIPTTSWSRTSFSKKGGFNLDAGRFRSWYRVAPVKLHVIDQKHACEVELVLQYAEPAQKNSQNGGWYTTIIIVHKLDHHDWCSCLTSVGLISLLWNVFCAMVFEN